MADLYPGAVDLVVLETWPLLFAVALDFAPDGPLTWADIQGHVLPYGEMAVAGNDTGYFYASESLRLLDSQVTLYHPPGSGSLTALGLAIAWVSQPEWLIATVPIPNPIATTQPGDSLVIPITLTVLADPSSEG